MKRNIVCCFLLLIQIAAFAQTVVQPSSGNAEEPQNSSWTDHMALAITALSVSALVFYLVYLFISRKKRK